ncbi:MAG: sterol desaturase family protein, partial [Pseudomonadota bacterium]|nr:sterol desaturase family protein [Pseudomonadota bacterium]
GKTIEHILISPAQHQIHHSLKPEHHNKNFGEIFAFWDWMFGTLFIPDKEETIEYGIARPDGSGQRIKQPHNNFKEALIVPFKESARALKRSKNKRSKP